MTARSAHLVTQAMQIMDRVEAYELPTAMTAEQLVRKTYQQQGLTVSDAALRQALFDREATAEKATTEETGDQRPLTMLERLGMVLLVGGFVFSAVMAVSLFVDRRPLSNAEMVFHLREAVAIPSDTPAQIMNWLNHDPQGRQIRQHGDFRVTEKGDELTVVWSQVSSAMCQAVVTSVNDDPSQLRFAIDGKAQQVSCAGPSHTITMTRRAPQRL